MNVYIDLGAHKGALLEKVVNGFDDIDLFIAFECVPNLYKRVDERFKNNPKVKVLNKAVSCSNGELTFYVDSRKNKPSGAGEGSTLIKGIYNDEIIVESVDFSDYLEQNFDESDNIIVKLDIEGYEYELLDHLIDTGNIKYINKMFCEWHEAKLIRNFGNADQVKSRHNDLVYRLQGLGFKLKGKNNTDELSKIKKQVFSKRRLF